MSTVSLRCYAELNDFLPPSQRFIAFPLSVPSHARISEIAEKIGIPIELIDVVLVNNESVSLFTQVEENDRVALYPVFENFDISSVTHVRDIPLRQSKFILDVHLGKLAHHLRMCGIDTLYQNNWMTEALIAISRQDHRILLSRSTSLVSNEELTHAHLIKDTDPRVQLLEVLEWFDLFNSIRPFTRCIACNTILQPVSKGAVYSRIPMKVQEWCQEFQLCSSCNRIYWKGSHYQCMNSFIQKIFSERALAKNPNSNE